MSATDKSYQEKHPFIWTPTVNAAFLAVKEALVRAPVLALPNFTKEFVLETDACEKGVWAVLMQHGCPIVFLSRALGIKNQCVSIYDKEFLEILMAIDKWKMYLHHKQFTIYTDHRSLVHLGDHKFNTKIQQKAFFRLMGLHYHNFFTRKVHLMQLRMHCPGDRSSVASMQYQW